MIEREFIIKNDIGLHAGPAAKFTRIASRYKSEIRVIKETRLATVKAYCQFWP